MSASACVKGRHDGAGAEAVPRPRASHREFNTKARVAVDTHDMQVGFYVTAGAEADSLHLAELIEEIPAQFVPAGWGRASGNSAT